MTGQCLNIADPTLIFLSLLGGLAGILLAILSDILDALGAR